MSAVSKHQKEEALKMALRLTYKLDRKVRDQEPTGELLMLVAQLRAEIQAATDD